MKSVFLWVLTAALVASIPINASINKAIEAAAPGSMVVVGPGIYDEVVVVNKPIRIIFRDAVVRGIVVEADAYIMGAVVEGEGVDLITMGRQEGPGCYCFANDVLRSVVDNLQDNYPLVVVDNEAGLEHLSRRTTRHVDWMVLVSDPAPKGLKAVERVLELIRELGLDVRKKSLVVNRVPEAGLDETLAARLEKMDLDGPPLLLPADPDVTRSDLEGRSLLEMDSCRSCELVDEFFSRITGHA